MRCHEFCFKNDNGTFTSKDGMDIVYPLEVEYGDFGIEVILLS